MLKHDIHLLVHFFYIALLNVVKQLFIHDITIHFLNKKNEIKVYLMVYKTDKKTNLTI